MTSGRVNRELQGPGEGHPSGQIGGNVSPCASRCDECNELLECLQTALDGESLAEARLQLGRWRAHLSASVRGS